MCECVFFLNHALYLKWGRSLQSEEDMGATSARSKKKGARKVSLTRARGSKYFERLVLVNRHRSVQTLVIIWHVSIQKKKDKATKQGKVKNNYP